MKMLAPKIKEIEKKFLIGESLSNKDVDTLLLHSQHNHFTNKLDGLTNNIYNLETRFVNFENKIENLGDRFNELGDNFKLFNAQIETTIQKALNRNMFFLIAIMSGFLILSKIIDKF